MSQQLSSEQIQFKERIEELAVKAKYPQNMSADERKEYEDYISQQNQSTLTPIEQNFLAYLRQFVQPKPKLFSFTNAFAKPHGGRRSKRKTHRRKTRRCKNNRRKTHRR